MRGAAFLIAVELTLCAMPVAAQPARPLPAPVQPADVIAHLERTIAWYRQITAVEQQPGMSNDLASRDRLHQAAIKALQLAFAFARAEAMLLQSQPGGTPAAQGPETGAGSNLEQLGAQLTARVATLQSRLNDIETALQRASGRTRGRLVNERDALIADLNLTRTIHESVGSILQFATTSALTERATDTLSAQINELARSVPEVGHLFAASTGAAATPTPSTSTRANSAPSGNPPVTGATGSVRGETAPAFHPESAGLMALVMELFSIETDRRALNDLLGQTEALSRSIEERQALLTSEVRELIREGDLAISESANDAQVAEGRRNLQAAVGRVKQLSTAIVPVGEQAIAVETARNALVSWRNGLTERMRLAGRYLFMRTIIIVSIIVLLLGLSEAWRRATFRYLRDARRRGQLLLLRRIVVGVAIAVVLVLGLVSEVGSLATYAGFVTAGLAVALQNVILAVVAYFFLVGRYGIRVGDRVTIAGVTGNVVEIGLVRIYLMELAGPDWRPTGRIVVFSNAVLFQPSALFRQMPGVDYVWRRVTLTLLPETDLSYAERQLGEAVDKVYEQYREGIEQQHATLERAVDVQTPVPRPEGHARFSSNGVEVSIRYPVDRSQVSDIDRRVIMAIREAITNDPALTLAASGGPKIEDES